MNYFLKRLNHQPIVRLTADEDRCWFVPSVRLKDGRLSELYYLNAKLTSLCIEREVSKQVSIVWISMLHCGIACISMVNVSFGF